MATVETRGIKKLFGDVVAVNGIDLLTRDGEFLVLLGPSGCGKSTLLRMIAGFEKPTEGDLLIGGDVVNDIAATGPENRDGVSELRPLSAHDGF